MYDNEAVETELSSLDRLFQNLSLFAILPTKL